VGENHEPLSSRGAKMLFPMAVGRVLTEVLVILMFIFGMGLVVGLVLVMRWVGKQMAATGIPLQGVRGGLVVTRSALCRSCGAGLSCGKLGC
jgi:hypothetical protein